MTDLAPQETVVIPKDSCLSRADILIQELLKMLKQETPSTEIFHQLGDRLQVPSHPQARIYFLTQLYHYVHEFPLRLFQDLERREDLLYMIQDALDTAILSEE